MPSEPNSRYAASEQPEPAKVRFSFDSALAGWLYTLGQLQVLLSILAALAAFLGAATDGLAGMLPGVVGTASLIVSGSVTSGLSYLVENAARELTRMDRE